MGEGGILSAAEGASSKCAVAQDRTVRVANEAVIHVCCTDTNSEREDSNTVRNFFNSVLFRQNSTFNSVLFDLAFRTHKRVLRTTL